MKIYTVTGLLSIYDSYKKKKILIEHGGEMPVTVFMDDDQFDACQKMARPMSVVCVKMSRIKNMFWLDSLQVVVERSTVAEKREAIWREEAKALLKEKTKEELIKTIEEKKK